MKTEATRIDTDIYVFAKAKPDWKLENLAPGELPFTYEVKSYDYGDENCVRICEVPVSVQVPAGIDITLACIENLKELIEVVRKEADKKIENLENRIRALALIEYKPKPEVIDGVAEENSDSSN